MDGTLFVAAGTAAYCLMGWWESRSHRRNLDNIPLRIHVNGTRGKSGVARLIAAGLRAGGLRTFAKTTGTLARAIFPDGTEYPVFRPGRTNVIEQVRMTGLAAELRADAMVIECMALHPSLQSMCELELVKSTHGVITNARADHLDVMGPTADDVALALAGTVPVNGTLYTAERKYLGVLQAAAVDRNSRCVGIDAECVARVSPAELEAFSYVAHAENVALALEVCAELGVDRTTALQGMWSATPDPGVMRVLQLRRAAQRVAFVSGFAANDPESTGCIWHMMCDRYPQVQTRIALVNCRADRRHRSVQLAEAARSWQPADHFLLVGSGTDIFQRVAVENGIPLNSLHTLEGASTEEIAQQLFQYAGHFALVMGMGNTAGPGLELVTHLQNYTTPTASSEHPSERSSSSSSASARHSSTLLQEAA